MKADLTEHPIDPAWEDDPTCPECHGEGGHHDCMEDSCPCLNPYEGGPDWWVCEACLGSGEIHPTAEDPTDE